MVSTTCACAHMNGHDHDHDHDRAHAGRRPSATAGHPAPTLTASKVAWAYTLIIKPPCIYQSLNSHKTTTTAATRACCSDHIANKQQLVVVVRRMMASPSSRVGVAVWQACRTVAWRVRAAVDALPPVGVIGTQQPPSQLWGGLQAAGVGGAATQPQAADGEPQGLQQTLEDLVGALNEHIWFAVPKKRVRDSGIAAP